MVHNRKAQAKHRRNDERHDPEHVVVFPSGVHARRLETRATQRQVGSDLRPDTSKQLLA